MSEIQAQVEQTMADLKLTVGRVGVEGISKYYALLRKVVEECCEVTDRYHADGLTELIQEKFAWLEGE